MNGGYDMILAFHSIFAAHGFWLPNDPRGSWSRWVASWDLFRYGPGHENDDTAFGRRRQTQRGAALEAKEMLKYPPVVFTGYQALAISHGFADAIRQSGYQVLACAILPEHVHLVIGRNLRSIRRIVGHFKGRATHHLIEEKLWPDAQRPVWAEKGWNVYIDSLAQLQAAVAYVERNPMKEGKKPQKWSFMTPLNDYLQLI